MSNNVLRLIVLLTILIIFQSISVLTLAIFNKKIPTSETLIETKNVTERSSSISLKVLDKPHHLFIGRCKPGDEILHGENIILNNDGKSQVSATIRINIEGAVNITCVKVFDQVTGGGGYPSFVNGGVGYNFVEFNVTAEYGEGFNFYVQVNGYTSEDNENDDELEE